jgi:hypothetical protein
MIFSDLFIHLFITQTECQFERIPKKKKLIKIKIKVIFKKCYKTIKIQEFVKIRVQSFDKLIFYQSR